MKNIITIITSVVLINIFAFGSDFEKDIAAERARKIMNNNSDVGFIENKGQYVNDKGELVPFVLFKTTVSSTDMYITTKGITYVFLKLKPKEEEESHAGKNEVDAVSGATSSPEKEKNEEPIEWCRVDMNIVGANINKNNVRVENLVEQGYTNYYLAHCPDGILNVKTYRKITIKDVYPHIDWVIYASEQKGLKYDFIVHAGGNPKQIRLQYAGAKEVQALDNGQQLLIKAPFGEVKEGAITCYEETGKRIQSQYTVNEENEVSFNVSDYNKNQCLIIDPPLELVWATYYGGNNTEEGYCISTDLNGNLFVAGYTASTNFPTQNPLGGAYFQGVYAGNNDAIILKFNNAGVREWATHYGGSNDDKAYSITNNATGDIYVTGETKSANFPVQLLAGAYNQGYSGGSDIFILRFTNSGVCQWATYYGDSLGEQGNSIITDAVGNVFVTGSTSSINFPTLNPGGGAFYQSSLIAINDAFILKFTNAGVCQWATYFGGDHIDGGYSITTDMNGNVFVTGFTKSTNFPTINAGGGAYFQPSYAGGGWLGGDAFILKFTNSGVCQWATYYGGNDTDVGYCIATDVNNNVLVMGYAQSTNFPVQNSMGAFFQAANGGQSDVFLSKFDNSGVSQWSTYYGGNGADYPIYWDRTIAGNKSGDVFIAFEAHSPNVSLLNPGSCAYFDSSFAGAEDGVVTQFNNMNAMEWSTYYGGSDYDQCRSIVTDTSGCIFVLGHVTISPDIDTVNPGGGAYFQGTYGGGMGEIILLKFCPCCTLQVDSQPVSQTICEGDSATFTVSASGDTIITYQWYFNGNIIIGATDSSYIINPATTNDAGSYYCVVNNTCGKTDTSNIAVLTMLTPPVITSQPEDTTICEGQNITFTISVTGSDTIEYQWYFNGNAVTSATDSFYTINLVSTNDGGNYYCIVTNPCGDDTSNVASLTVLIPPVITIQPNDQTICEGDTVTFNVRATGSDTINYQWYFNGSAITGATDSIYTINSVSANDSGNYYCIVENICGDDTSNLAMLTINYPPTVDLGIDTTLCEGELLVLDAENVGSAYLWQNGSINPTYTVYDSGYYWVMVSNLCGSVTDSIYIDYKNCDSELWVPNAFTPNGDGDNDVFRADGMDIIKFEMYIYDRWGELLYKSDDIRKGWNGIYKGRLCQDDVYVWLISYESSKQPMKTIVGHVTLLH